MLLWQGMAGRFDMVVCLLGTLSHCLNNKQAAACLRCAAAHLRPGGVLVVELAHPGARAHAAVTCMGAACVPSPVSVIPMCRAQLLSCVAQVMCRRSLAARLPVRLLLLLLHLPRLLPRHRRCHRRRCCFAQATSLTARCCCRTRARRCGRWTSRGAR